MQMSETKDSETKESLKEQHIIQSPTKLHTLSGLRLEHTNFTRPKPLLLLAYLCIEGKKEKRFLAELFWPGASNHLNSLAKALSQLRQVGVVDNNETHAWATVSSDVNEFLDALEQRDLGTVITLYQDSFLSGFYLPDWGIELEEWIYTTREFLASQMRAVWLELAEASRDPQEITRYAERAYALEATLEPDHIVRLYKLLSTTPHAAKLKDDAKEFGISLENQAKTIVASLPNRGTSFIGRDIERLELGELLSQNDIRLLTVVGQGGVGKTRLALEVAREVKENFRDGVVFIALESFITHEQAISSFSSVFGVDLDKCDDIIKIAASIGDKQLLLLLDNFEHLVHLAPSLSVLLHHCPNIKILVTSRQRLGLEEEWIYALEGFSLSKKMSLETAQLNDAVTLFVQRARKVKQGFTLTQEHLPSVLKICKRVEGLPLGIELAASWAKTLSCQEIAENLDDLDFLTASLNNVPERQQSLRVVFEGSWQLLSKEEQGTLSKLSVFRGGFTSEAAREIAEASFMMLARLVDKSLLRVSEGRYYQHALLQQYSREKLMEFAKEDEVCRHHAYYYLGFAKESSQHLASARQQEFIQKLERELSNLRAAFTWLLTSEEASGLHLYNALARFWTTSSYISEGRQWAREALTQNRTDVSPECAKLFHQAGTLAWLQGDYDEAHQHLHTALVQWQQLGDKGGRAQTLGNLANLATEEGDFSAAEAYYAEQLKLSRELGNTLSIANALGNSGILQAQQGYFDKAVSRYQEALALHRKLGNTHGVAGMLNCLGTIAKDQENYSSAILYAQESLELQRALGYKVGESIALNTLGVAALGQGEIEKARAYFKESLALQVDTASKPGIISSLEHFASLALAENEADKAIRLCAAAHVMRELAHFPLPPRSKERYDYMVQEAKNALGETGFATSWTLGSALDIEQAIRLTLEVRSDKKGKV